MVTQVVGSVSNFDCFSLESKEVSPMNKDEEIEAIKKEALGSLEKTLFDYRHKSSLINFCRMSIFLFRLDFALIFYLFTPANTTFENSMEKFLLLKDELLENGVDLSCYEPLDLLLEGFNQKKIFSTMTKEQVQLLRDMVSKDNKNLLLWARIYLLVSLPFLILFSFPHPFPLIPAHLLGRSWYLYLYREELKEIV